jgi:NADPH-dependent curcumin reductase CurA
MISQYNKTPDQCYGVKNLLLVVSKRIKIQGFITSDKDLGLNYLHERNERIAAVRTSFPTKEYGFKE